MILDVGASAQPGRRAQPDRAATPTRTCCCWPSARRASNRAQLLAFGASACLAKTTQSRDVLNAIHLASRGLQLTPRGGHGHRARARACSRPARPTCWRGLQQRRSNAQIAAELHVSVETVRTHARHIYRKLGVASRRELLAPATLSVEHHRQAAERHRRRTDAERALRWRPPAALDSPHRDEQRDRPAGRPSRRRRLLRVDRARPPPGAARAAGRRLRQRAARGRHDRQLRGAPLRRRLGDARLARAPAVPAGRVPAAGLPDLPRGLGADDGDRARARSSASRWWGSTRPTSTSTGCSRRGRRCGGCWPRSARELGLTCSVGIGPNKLVAKVASDAEKPAGLRRAQPRAGVRAVRRRIPPSLVPGIGPKTAARLRADGLHDARRSWRARREAAAGRALRPEPRAATSRGAPASSTTASVSAARKVVSESRERTFDTDISAMPGDARGDARDGGRALREPRRATAAAGARSASRCGSTTGRPSPARAPLARADARPGARRRRGAAAARRVRAAAPGPAARRAGRRAAREGDAASRRRRGRCTRQQLARRSAARCR